MTRRKWVSLFTAALCVPFVKTAHARGAIVGQSPGPGYRVIGAQTLPMFPGGLHWRKFQPRAYVIDYPTVYFTVVK